MADSAQMKGVSNGREKVFKWYNKVGYGSGDLAANMVYGLLTSFVLIYLTDTVGLNAGIVGTLMMFSKFADGVTDVFFGTLIDKTHSKMGKARPWMLWSYLGNAVMPDSIIHPEVGFGYSLAPEIRFRTLLPRRKIFILILHERKTVSAERIVMFFCYIQYTRTHEKKKQGKCRKGKAA